MNIRRNITAGVAGVLLTAGMATPAFAAMKTVHVGGGLWSRGTEGGLVKSHYHHENRNHGSSVKSGRGEGKTHYSGCTSPKKWARAEADDTFWRDEAYYNFCD